MRSTEEWIGKTDDSAIPPRVKLRVHERANGRCQKCGADAFVGEYDHIIPLIIGGENRENNLQKLCAACHKAKTKLDVKLKSKVARVRKRHLGIKKPSRFACSRNSKFKRKISGEVIVR